MKSKGVFTLITDHSARLGVFFFLARGRRIPLRNSEQEHFLSFVLEAVLWSRVAQKCVEAFA